MDKADAEKKVTGGEPAPVPEVKPAVPVNPQEKPEKLTEELAAAKVQIEHLEAEKKRLLHELHGLTDWQAQAVEKAESIYTKHQQLMKELRSSKAALNEAEAKLSVHKREVDILKMDFKNLQQALTRAEQDAKKSREVAAELEQCNKRLVENAPKPAA